MSDPQPAYRVLARRFRPNTFDEVVGQRTVLQSLRTELDSGRVPHALLFSGSRGTGKTTMARIFARALNCERGVGSQPCGECQPCKTTLAGRNPDVVEIDAASHNLVDDIRDLRDRVGFASMGSRYKVYILDEVHMLTRNAFNAFLKTLEEPPARVVFILATTELHKVPDTIRSRCQLQRFERIGDRDIVDRLRTICECEGIEADDAVLAEIATASRGGMRDAETTLEQLLPIVSANGGRLDADAYRSVVHRVGLDLVVDAVELLCAGDAAAGLRFAAEIADHGVDEREALGELLDALRAVLLLKVDGPETKLATITGVARDRLASLAADIEVDRLDAMIHAALLGRERIRRLDDRRLVLEVTLLRMAEAGSVPALGEIVERLASGGAFAGVAPAEGASASAAVAAAPSGLKSALLAALAKRKPMLQATVEACDVTGPADDGSVEFRLRSPRKMHVDRLRSDEVRALLAEILAEVVGRPVQVRLASDETSSGGANPKSKTPSGPRSPAVERIAKRFDGKFLDS
ncbi:MAG: DNA polymerase III subunit gamma/tau [Planctomycetes bacterium]|nr:DNA polymerase III subunit gamma/tau [Planctomycetota bacterium]